MFEVSYGNAARCFKHGNHYMTSITPFGATNGASEIVSLARAKLRPGTSKVVW